MSTPTSAPKTAIFLFSDTELQACTVYQSTEKQIAEGYKTGVTPHLLGAGA